MYAKVTLKGRYQISSYIKTGYTQNQIANILGISQSTISRGIKRNSSKGKYKPELAE
ncbi:helix-turn-helix domain-containing protein [Arcobacter arenosus]|uniref:helix-turn-helix domain-containing protein n=1 Tax=Arcobacter arenosus TaxID=2576037 RepID=UPI001E3F573F|nr:helix-turn-helix domain-containing protein [Arcobacter arenosus]